MTTPYDRRPIITLTSDFGLADGYVASMKGVLLALCPEARLIDITHLTPPHDILPAALILEATAPYFPPATVHLVVVDPGVGSDRRPVAVAAGGQYFVGPDNGVFTPFLQEGIFAGAVIIEEERFRLKRMSATFHGRDLFAPAAAHLARGADYRSLGTPVDDLVKLEWPGVTRERDMLRGVVLHIDHFGNAISSIKETDLPPREAIRAISCKGVDFGPLRRHYAEVIAGAPVALINSMGRLEVAFAQANVAVALGIKPGDEVVVYLKSNVTSFSRGGA